MLSVPEFTFFYCMVNSAITNITEKLGFPCCAFFIIHIVLLDISYDLYSLYIFRILLSSNWGASQVSAVFLPNGVCVKQNRNANWVVVL